MCKTSAHRIRRDYSVGTPLDKSVPLALSCWLTWVAVCSDIYHSQLQPEPKESQTLFTIANLSSVSSQQCLWSPEIFWVKDYTSARQEKKRKKEGKKKKTKTPLLLSTIPM